MWREQQSQHEMSIAVVKLCILNYNSVLMCMDTCTFPFIQCVCLFLIEEVCKNSQSKSSSIKNIPKNMTADASKWEVADVIKFLESVGFPQEAKSFAEQVYEHLKIHGHIEIYSS